MASTRRVGTEPDETYEQYRDETAEHGRNRTENPNQTHEQFRHETATW